MAMTTSAPARRRLGSRSLFAVLSLYFGLPLLAAAMYSVATTWTRALPEGYTLAHWGRVFTQDDVLSALGRSAVLAVTVVAIDVLLVVPAAYWSVVHNTRIRSVVSVLAVIPFAVPWVVLGAGIQFVTATFAPQLFGTFWLLAAATAAIAFPFLYWAVESALAGADAKRLAEAAAACGASPLTTLLRVILPIAKGGVISGALLVVAVSINEFALAKILVASQYETLPLWSARLFTSRTAGDPNALAVVTIFTFLALFTLAASVVVLGRGREGSTGGAATLAPTSKRK